MISFNSLPECSGTSIVTPIAIAIISTGMQRSRHRFRFIEFVSSPEKKYFAFTEMEITLHHTHPVPNRGAYHDRHDRGAGMRWTPKQRLTSAADAYGKDVWS
jgi:hypothetical protein